MSIFCEDAFEAEWVIQPGRYKSRYIGIVRERRADDRLLQLRLALDTM